MTQWGGWGRAGHARNCVDHLWAFLLDFKCVWVARVRVHCAAIETNHGCPAGLCACTAPPLIPQQPPTLARVRVHCTATNVSTCQTPPILASLACIRAQSWHCCQRWCGSHLYVQLGLQCKFVDPYPGCAEHDCQCRCVPGNPICTPARQQL